MSYKIKNKKAKEKEHYEIPYEDKAKTFANPHTKEIMVFKRNYLGKGWYATYVNGKLVDKSRTPKNYSQYVPNGYKEISLFSEMSYHSSLNQNEQGKISNYGTKDYTLQYSDYKSIGKYHLESPIKTSKKDEFGKIKNDVELQEWEYAVLDWNVGRNKGLQISYKIKSPYGNDKEVYKSKIYKMSEKDEAIKDFREYVEKIKREKKD